MACPGVSSDGATVYPTPPVSASSICAGVDYLTGGLGQFVISGVLLRSYPVSCVNLSMLSLILPSPPGRAAASVSTVLSAAMEP